MLATRPPLPSLAIAAGVIGYRLGLLGDFDMFELEGVDPVSRSARFLRCAL